VIVGVALAGGLALWTLQRIGEAKTVQSNVEARRSEDSERAAMLLREPAKVSVVRGVPDAWQPRVELDGTLQAQREASLGFKVGGRLARVNVKVGDRVKAGSVLAQLDGAEAAALAQDSERRTLPLVQTGSFAEATGVQATQQRQLAGAQLDAARAQHALARSGVGNHALSAPFGGTITQAPTGIGGVVAPGQALFGLVDTSTLKLATTVSEDDANLLVQGAECRISTEQGELTGRITAILATLDPTTRRVPVVAEFTNGHAPTAKAPLRSGAFVRAWVAADEVIPVLRVPHGVLRPGSQDEVLAVNASSSRLELRRLVFAVAPDGQLLVRRGITAVDELVLDPMPEAKTGDLVKAEPALTKSADGIPKLARTSDGPAPTEKSGPTGAPQAVKAVAP
jgi:RND family efflux transporter MFP subunit